MTPNDPVSSGPGPDHKQAAVRFLQMVVGGRIEEAYRQYVDMQGKHHNPFFPAGFPALQQGMLDNYSQFPNEQITVQHVLGDGDHVAVHSHVVPSPGGPGFATLHLFRFQGGKIVEIWDLGQPVPGDSPNPDGMF